MTRWFLSFAVLMSVSVLHAQNGNVVGDGVCCDPDAAVFDAASCFGAGHEIYPSDGLNCDIDCGPVTCPEFGGCMDTSACNYAEGLAFDDGSCIYIADGECDCDGNVLDECGVCGGNGSNCNSPYTLTVESSPAVGTGGTVYRFYVNMEDPTDRMSAVFGNDQASLLVSTPDGAFNSAVNSSWNASGINPAFLPFFPDLADDTYATIGLEGPASTSGIAGAADPSIVEDSNQPVTPYFLTPGATDLVSTTLTGASWYLLSTAANGLPDSNMRVLIMQVTTAGAISGQINYQVFPLGVGGDQLQLSATFDGIGTFSPVGGPGCTDLNACNYNPDATTDDGSCQEFDECGVCGGSGIPAGDCDCDGNQLDALGICGGSCYSDQDGDGVCDDIPGCTTEDACNYNIAATIDDGSCEYFSCASLGCTDSDACNYNANAIYEDGSCTYPDALGECGGTCEADANGNGVCDDNEVNGCTDAMACNFDSAATVDDGTCVPDNDEDGICDDVDDCVGTYDACGVCSGPGAIYECGCTELPAGDCDCDGNQLDVLGECGGMCVTDSDGDGLCDDVDDCVGAYDACGVCNGAGATYECGCSDIPPGDCDCNGNQLDALGVCGGECAEDANANGICDSEEIEGCTDSAALNFNVAANVDDGSCVGTGDLPAGWGFVATPMSAVFLGNVTVDGALADETTVLGAFSESGLCVGWALPVTVDGVSYASLTLYGDDETTEEVDGMQAGEAFSLRLHLAESDTTLTYRQNGTLALLSGWANTNGAPMSFYSDPEETYDFSLFAECQDPLACNYNPGSASNEGCEYPPFGYGCDGQCLNDSDGDGTCDEFELPGCTDVTACNFNSAATEEDGSCQELDECGVCGGSGIHAGDCDCAGNQVDALGECGGDCAADVDADGICDDVDDCVGTYDTCGVCNGQGAIYECGCADVPAGDCDCDGNELDAIGLCGGACVADADADGVCDDIDDCVGEYDAVGVCNGSCEEDLDGDGVCDSEEVLGCDDPAAVNFEVEATENDGSCNYEGLEAPEGFGFVPGPTSATVLGIVTLDGLAGSGLDWVGAFTPQGVCAGAANLTVFDGTTYVSLTIYGDDPTTPDAVEGIASGGTFSLRLFDASEGTIISYNSGQQFSGWVNTNGGALPGYSNPETVYAFFTPACPDTDGDGICNDDDDCPNQAADAVGECGGDCENDFNGNGVCDDAEVFGCTYEWAENFDPAATTDIGTCIFPGQDGETIWATCEGDISGDGLVGVEDLLDLLLVYNTACE